MHAPFRRICLSALILFLITTACSTLPPVPPPAAQAETSTATSNPSREGVADDLSAAIRRGLPATEAPLGEMAPWQLLAPCWPEMFGPCVPPLTYPALGPPPHDAPVRFAGEVTNAAGTFQFWSWVKAGEASRPCTTTPTVIVKQDGSRVTLEPERDSYAVFKSSPCDARIGDAYAMTPRFNIKTAAPSASREATEPLALSGRAASRDSAASRMPLAELREAALRLRRDIPADPDVVAARLDALAAGRPELEWRWSVVDLLGLAGVDSSFDRRLQLDCALNYEGLHCHAKPYTGSESQNVRLHAAVLAALADGRIPMPAAPTGRANREATDSSTPLRPEATRPPNRRIVFGTSYEDFKPITSNQAAALASLGFDVVRPTAIWAYINPAPGVYDWSKPDADFRELRAAGLLIVPSVAWPPAHASGGKPAYLPYTDGCTRFKVGATSVFDIEFNDAVDYCRNPPHIDPAASYEFGYEFERRYGHLLWARAIGNEPGFKIFWPPSGDADSMYRYITEFIAPMTRGMLDAAAGTQPAIDPELASRSGDLLNGGVPTASDGRIEMLITLPASLREGWLITSEHITTMRPYRQEDVRDGGLVVRLHSPCPPGATGPRPIGPVRVALMTGSCIGATCKDNVLLFDGEPNQPAQCGGRRRPVTPGGTSTTQRAGRRAQFVGPEADSAGVMEEALILERDLGIELYDAVTFHPYPWPPDPTVPDAWRHVFGRLNEFELAAAPYRDARPQWYSESGGMDVLAFIREILASDRDVSLISIGDFQQWFVAGSWAADRPVLNERGKELQKLIRDAVAGRAIRLHVGMGGDVLPFRESAAAASLRRAA